MLHNSDKTKPPQHLKQYCYSNDLAKKKVQTHTKQILWLETWTEYQWRKVIKVVLPNTFLTGHVTATQHIRHRGTQLMCCGRPHPYRLHCGAHHSNYKLFAIHAASHTLPVKSHTHSITSSRTQTHSHFMVLLPLSATPTLTLPHPLTHNTKFVWLISRVCVFQVPGKKGKWWNLPWWVYTRSPGFREWHQAPEQVSHSFTSSHKTKKTV